MKAFLYIAILAIIACAVSAEVFSLTESNYKDFVNGQEYSLVKFFAPWCGHCKALKEPYEQAAKQLAGKAKIAEVDCTTDGGKPLCDSNGVRGYPTLKFIGKDGSVVDYDEARTADAIVSYVLGATQPAIAILADEAQVNEFKKAAGELKLIVNAKEESEVGKAVVAAAKKLRKLATIALDVTKDDNSAVLLRTFDEPELKLDQVPAKNAAEVLTKFVEANSLPLIGEIGPHNYKKYVDKNLPLVWLFYSFEDKTQEPLVESLLPVAKKYADKVVIAKLDGVKWGQHAKSFGLESATPGIVIEDRAGRKKYAYPKDVIDADAFEAFLAGFVDGSLAPIFRSEDVPASNNGPVTTIVGKNYEAVVNKSDKDVFVIFHAPWCGHCKKAMPQVDELGALYADDANVVIGKIDATANDYTASFEVTGFPTIYFFKGDNKAQPVRYNGDRTADAFKSFIEKNRSTQPAAASDDAAKDEL